jgi:hypothetical protein
VNVKTAPGNWNPGILEGGDHYQRRHYSVEPKQDRYVPGNSSVGQSPRSFSCCTLTHDSNRLPALSSLAEQFAASAKLGRYVAGLWEELLIEGLQW